MAITKRMKLVREEKRISQAKLARLADVNQTSISRIETGKELAYPKRGQKIADALGWTGSLDELFEDVDVETGLPVITSDTCTLKRVQNGQFLECSNCKSLRSIYDSYNYCDNCGAKVLRL